MIRAFYEEFTAVIIDVIDGFRVVRVFIHSLTNIPLHHVVEYLEDITKDVCRLLCGEIEKRVERERRTPTALLDIFADTVEDAGCWPHGISSFPCRAG